MAVSPQQIAAAHDLFDDLGDITTRKMMGGLCIYAGGKIFAMIDADGTFFIKAKDALAEEMAAAGARIFTYTRKDGGAHTMAYWALPDDALDDPQRACDWARKSLDSN